MSNMMIYRLKFMTVMYLTAKLQKRYVMSKKKRNCFVLYSLICTFARMREQQLNLPAYDVRISERDGRQTIFDFLRNRYVALTPEEWVRQHFTHFLVEHKGYPKGLLANEIELRVGSKRLRCDTVLYDQSLRPRMIIEYKAPHIKIQQKTFDQIVVYNLLLHADYLVVSNGLQHYCCQMDYENRSYRFLTEIPDYDAIMPYR